jgi:uncharacterized OB-fold protein
MKTKSYPQPKRDGDNAAFLDAWAEGRLLIQHCRDCQRTFFYPRPFCPYCWSSRLEAGESVGKGTVVSFSLVRRPNDPAFNNEVPIVLAEVKVAEGAVLITRIIDVPAESVRSGLAVELAPLESGAQFPLPVFRPSVG